MRIVTVPPGEAVPAQKFAMMTLDWYLQDVLPVRLLA